MTTYLLHNYTVFVWWIILVTKKKYIDLSKLVELFIDFKLDELIYAIVDF